MSQSCMHDPYEQCFRECKRCVKYQPPNHDCKYCGAEENLYDIGESKMSEYVCEKCLEKAVIDNGQIKNKDAIVEFLTEYSNEFHEFLKDWFSEARVVHD